MTADVCVVLPHFNALETVGRSIESVISQTLAVRELVIVDDASADFAALARLVAHYSDRLPITLIPLAANGGAANARNVGITHASSRYVAFLDSDDEWHPHKIEIQYGYMQMHPVSLTGHGYIFDLHQQPFGASSAVATKTLNKRSFVWGNPLFTPTVMARRDSFIPFDPRFRRVDDYKCWYENLLNGNHHLLMLPLAGGYKHAIGSSGLTGSVRLMHQSYLEVLRTLREEKKIAFADYVLTVFCEAVKYPIRSLLILLRKR
jgi:glycosyltransferase involved in cell wall biosynthesis